MDNENMKENENMETENTAADETATEAAALNSPSGEETEAAVSESAEETPSEETATEKEPEIEDPAAEEMSARETAEFSEEASETETFEPAEGSEFLKQPDFSEGGEFTSDMPDEEDEAALLAAAAAKQKSQKMFKTIGAAVLAVAVILAAWCVCVMNGVGGKTVVNTPIPAEDGQTAPKTSIKFESPIISGVESLVYGKADKTAIKVNDTDIDESVFRFLVNTQGLNYVYTLLQSGEIKSVKGFDWNKVEEKSGLTYNEYVKAKAVEAAVPIYALISAGEKNGVKLSDEEVNQIKSRISEIKNQYGSQFETVLKQSGYEDEKTFESLQKVQALLQKVSEDIDKDITKYASREQLSSYLGDDKVTVKHILVKFADDKDESKAAAKKKADELYAKIKAGEDFDKLLKDNNEDPGQPETGYTFANDGSMVQEFADAAFALKIGDVSEPVETTFGYHIIKRLERTAGIEEYANYLTDTAKVRIKKSVFDKVGVSVNLEDYFGSGDEGSNSSEDAKSSGSSDGSGEQPVAESAK